MLFYTQDGGLTWQPRNLPIGEPVAFVDSQTGWTAGGAGGNELYVTRDGGYTWQPADFIKAELDAVFYGLPVFSDLQFGVIAVTIGETGASRVEFYNTQNGGQSWQMSGLMPLDPQNEPGGMVPVSVVGPLSMAAADESANQLFTFGTLGLQKDQAQPSSLPDGVVEIQFINELEGWAKTVQSTCTGEKSVFSSTLSCSVSEGLWKTLDGGRNWTQIR
jgi:photosystem II stability/assembly factor-like uncharacterized protein